MPGIRTFWIYVVVPVTMAGISNRGTRVPTTLYWLTGLSGATGALAIAAAVPSIPEIVALKSLPPSS